MCRPVTEISAVEATRHGLSSEALTRGTTVQNGLFVGVSKADVIWIARASRALSLGEAYRLSCERFDALLAEWDADHPEQRLVPAGPNVGSLTPSFWN